MDSAKQQMHSTLFVPQNLTIWQQSQQGFFFFVIPFRQSRAEPMGTEGQITAISPRAGADRVKEFESLQPGIQLFF